VEPNRVIARVATLFSGASEASVPQSEVVAEPPGEGPSQVFKFLAKEQAHVVLGFPGVTFANPDRFSLEVLAHVLSGQGGRLFSEIREKRALAYRVSAFSLEGVDPGYFAVYVATSSEKVEEAMRAIRQELKAVAENGISADELHRAQRYLIGTHAIGLQRRSAIAAALAFYEAYGQGWKSYRLYGDNIMKITVADVVRVARKYLDPQREVVAVVEPAVQTPGAARAAARAGGSVTGSRGRAGEASASLPLWHDPESRSIPR
jgi:zinc protease